MIAIVDYGVGNIFSLCRSLEYIGAEVTLTADKSELERADRVILPGVGAFGDAAEKLRRTGLWDNVISCAAKKPLLGICLGMQLLLEQSSEFGVHRGLSLIGGSVVPIAGVVPESYKIPHIGWNVLNFPGNKPKSPLFDGISDGEHVYFVHSYYAADCDESTTATTEYGAVLTAAVSDGQYVHGVQFHPEKSGETGLTILRNFLKL